MEARVMAMVVKILRKRLPSHSRIRARTLWIAHKRPGESGAGGAEDDQDPG